MNGRARFQEAEPVNFSSLTVWKFLTHMKKVKTSSFTLQVRFSAIKGLARWVVGHPDRFAITLNWEQLEAMREVERIRSPPARATVSLGSTVKSDPLFPIPSGK